MNKRNVTPALIMDMYAHQVVSGKQVKTYLKLQLPVIKNKYETIEVDIEIPQEDIQSRRIMVGKKILIERIDSQHIRYLGPEGDWETMIQFGVSPNDHVTFDAKFHGFSENDGIRYIKENDHLVIKAGDQVLATAEITGKGLQNCRYLNEIGKKLLIDWGRPRGLSFPITQMFSD